VHRPSKFPELVDLSATDPVGLRRRPQRPKELLDMVFHRVGNRAGAGFCLSCGRANYEQHTAPDLFDRENSEVVGEMREVLVQPLGCFD
jgi:hypothetical protein